MRFNDALVGVAIVLFAGYGLLLVSAFPDYPRERFGPGLFPAITFTITLACGCILIVRGLAARHAGSAWVSLDSWARQPSAYALMALIIGVVLFYIAFSSQLGFLLAGFVVVAAPLVWMRGRRHLVRSVLVSVLAVSVIFVVFSRILRVPLPLGLIADLIY